MGLLLGWYNLRRTAWTLPDTMNTDWLDKQVWKGTGNRYCLYFRKYKQLQTLYLFVLFICGPSRSQHFFKKYRVRVYKILLKNSLGFHLVQFCDSSQMAEFSLLLFLIAGAEEMDAHFPQVWVWFYSVSTIVSYLMTNPVCIQLLNIWSVNTFCRCTQLNDQTVLFLIT